MILTDKAKQDFEEWISNNCHCSVENSDRGDFIWFGNDTNFYQLPFSMQYGVLVDWFTEVGFNFEVGRNWSGEKGFFSDDFEWNLWHNPLERDFTFTEGTERTLNEARTKAIEKANTLYNQK